MKKHLLIATVLTSASLSMFSCGSSEKDKYQDALLDAKAEQMANELMDSISKESLAGDGKWVYEETKDEMSSAKNRFATITSSNVIELEFPYAGGTVGNIIVRNMNGKDEVLFTVNQGQINSTYDQETFEVRFDENPSEKYRVSESSDGSSDVRFFSNSKKLIENLKNSKECKIKVEFYNNGSHVFKFKTADLKW